MKHELTLRNTRELTLRDTYIELQDMSDAEYEDLYDTSDEEAESRIFNYMADLYDNDKKVAELVMANFDGVPSWSELAVNNVTSRELETALKTLGFEKDCLDIDCEYGKFEEDEEVEWHSTCEEVFERLIKELEVLLNKR